MRSRRRRGGDRNDLRVRLVFAAFGAILLLLVGRLFHLQVVRASLNRAQVDRQQHREELLPAPRGTIVDRHGRLLAYDRPVMAVRAEAYATLRAGREREDAAEFAAGLAADLSYALAADPEQSDQRARLRGRIASALLRGAPADARARRKIDFLVSPLVESAAVIERLCEVDERRSYLHLHFVRGHERTYPDRDVTVGPVGFVGERDLGGGRGVAVYRGMEVFRGLQPGPGGRRALWQDVAALRYWTAEGRQPARPAVLQSTLDLALQRAAHDELRRAVALVEAEKGSAPEWGALCLAEVESGDLLAMASFRDGVDDPRLAAFAPTQCLCPPGSVVKPLVFALALERGALDWDRDRFDCRPTGPKGWKVPGVSRWIEDSHPCGWLTPREILVQSSNVGAVLVGQRLGRKGLIEVIERFGFGTRTGTRLPGELEGVVEPRLSTMPRREFEGYAGPSLSFGYGYNLTPLQVLRAYLTLLSGRPRELRLYRRAAAPGTRVEVPSPPEGPVFLSERTRALLRDAMAGVVTGEHQATGRDLPAALGLPEPLPLAGKTGTSEYTEVRDGQRVMVRTASFAGFAPVARPRFAVICVLQKPGAERFWGGRYAAPAAGRLLLRALSQPPPGRPASPQVSAGASEGVRAPAHVR